MKISFVIPAYNEEGTIAGCIDSIKAEVRGRSDIEIIVVNNASTDRTREVALQCGVRVVDEPRKGLVWARAAGHSAAVGEIVANIDADVRLIPGWLKTVEEEFKDQHLVALSGPFIYQTFPVFTRAMVKLFYALGFFISFVLKIIMNSGDMLQGGNFCVRREALTRAGGYDTSINFYGEDTAVALAMAKVGKVKWTFKLPVYSSPRRLHGEGVVRMSFRYSLNYFWIVFFGRPYTHVYKDIRPK